MRKYYYYEQIFRDGEHEYYTSAVFDCEDYEDVRELINKHVLAKMWSDSTERIDNAYYSPEGDVAVYLGKVDEVTKKEWNVMKKRLLHDSAPFEKEEVKFT